MRINSNCIFCKGRYPEKYCGRSVCPVIMKNQALSKVKEIKITENFQADAPAIFVGRYGYPNVNVGFLTPPEKKEDTWIHDAPKIWSSRGFDIPKVINYRSTLINSRFKSDIKMGYNNNNNNNIKNNNKMIEIAQEVTQATKPVELEMNLQDKPKIKMNFDPYLAPTGPNANAKKVDITSNPHIEKQVEKRVSDIDLGSAQAVNELFNKGYDENFLSKLLSMGNLGIGKNRKLVPTRWSITAVDDTIGKEIIEQIKDYEMIQPTLFFGGYMGNYYLIMMFEDVWSYELFEMYAPAKRTISDENMEYATDYEGYEGRHNYAETTAGGYYACRIGLLEKLKQIKKQSSCLVMRFISEEYSCPLGVWVCREAVRKALLGKKHIFETKEQMIGYAKFIISKKFNYNIDIMLKESKLYNNIKKQTKLNIFSR
jgi:DNA repair protein NreA